MSAKRTALITGALTGIGRATVLRLARDGFRMAINYKNIASKNDILAMLKDLKRAGVDYALYQADVTNEHEVIEMFKNIKKHFGSIDAVINNAGVNITRSFGHTTTKDFYYIWETNLLGAVFVTRHALPLLAKSQRGRIIFIASLNAFTGSKKRSSYVAAKNGLIGLSRALAVELAPKILVNTVVPGYINTAMMRKHSRGTLREKLKRIPLKRFGMPEEVASAIAFLVSDDASYITGQCIHVNGGVFLS